MIEDTRPDWLALSTETRIMRVAAILADTPGLSSTQIAGMFDNCSRNSIIGLVNRNPDRLKLLAKQGTGDINARKKRAAQARQRKREEDAKARGVKPPKSNYEEAEPIPLPVPAPGDFLEARVPFLKADDHTCRWPMWDRYAGSETSMCCGHHTAKDSHYCEFHSGRARHAA